MRFIISLCIASVFFSCSGNTNPDVSDIKINLSTERFEQDFFSIDSQHMTGQIDSLVARYPDFGENYLNTILNCDPSWSPDTTSNYLNGFIAAYKPLYDSVEQIFGDFSPYETEIQKSLQYLKYYFPDYSAPSKIITYIGPLDGYGDILADDAFIIGLQHHLGKNSSFYQTTWLQETYPKYLTDRFEPEYIAINCMKNIILDIDPEKNGEATLSDQMIENGKRLYLLQKLMPETREHLLIGYRETQLKSCYDHEALIWNLFTQQNLLQITDYNIIKNYIGESPKTQELGEDAPGNIGAFTGWQIVKKFMKKNPETSLVSLVKTNPAIILEKARYKP